MQSISFLEQVAKVFLMVGITCAIGIAMGYPAAHWIGARLAQFLSFDRNEKYLEALPALGIPATKAVRGDLEGAAESYEALLLKYPKEKEIYFRLLEVVLGPMHAEAYGEDVLQRGLQNLCVESEKNALLNLSVSLKTGDYRPFKHLDSCPAPAVATIHPPRLGGQEPS